MVLMLKLFAFMGQGFVEAYYIYLSDPSLSLFICLSTAYIYIYIYIELYSYGMLCVYYVYIYIGNMRVFFT